MWVYRAYLALVIEKNARFLFLLELFLQEGILHGVLPIFFTFPNQTDTNNGAAGNNEMGRVLKCSAAWWMVVMGI